MSGMKYSPGFDDPSARPRLAKSGRRVLAATLFGIGVLFVALLVAFAPDIGAVMRAGAELLGLR